MRADALSLARQFPAQLAATVDLPDGEVQVGFRLKGQHVKLHLAVADDGGELVLDLKRVLLDGVDVGGNWLERFVPSGRFGRFTWQRASGSIRVNLPWPIRAAGVQGGQLEIILEHDQ